MGKLAIEKGVRKRYNTAMRRIFIGIIGLLFTLLACRAFMPGSTLKETRIPVPTVKTPTTPGPIPGSPAPTETAIPTATPSSTLTPTPLPLASTPTHTATQPKPVYEIRTHPDGGLFVGDQVSFEVIAPPDIDLNDEVLNISGDLEGETSMETQFAPFGIGGRSQSTLYWGWDTSELEAGAHPLLFSIQPMGITWTHTFTLGSFVEIPPPEPQAKWATDESDCCVFYYITETAAAREISATLKTADELADHAVDMLNIEFTEPLVVTLMSRVLGQGGFASSEMYISFLDRNYAGNSLEMVLHHEMVHILDFRLGGALRPTILIEGLAVYLTGGHYKPEALIPRAAVLLPSSVREDGLGLGWYLPLRPLVDDFYKSQHEIGYIQAGALVKFMIDTWGWDAYSAFYRDIQPIQNGAQSDALDAALQTHFELTLDELETNFLEMLAAQEIGSEVVDDVRLTVEYYDTMRRYQQNLDPSAYFLTAWLPNGPLMRERGIVADLVRRPSDVENLALETLLVYANQSLKTRDFVSMEDALAAVNGVLDALADGHPAPFDIHPLAKAHFEIAVILQQSGYQVEQIDIRSESAKVVASQGWPELTRFEFALVGNHWTLVNSY